MVQYNRNNIIIVHFDITIFTIIKKMAIQTTRRLKFKATMKRKNQQI